MIHFLILGNKANKAMLNHVLQNLRIGEVRAFALSKCDCIFNDSAPSDLDPDFRVITLTCSALPSLETLIDLFLEECAKIALAIWPLWFGMEHDIHLQKQNVLERLFERESLLRRLSHSQNDISKNWLKDSIRSCSQQKIPLFEHYPKALQVFNLSKAIHLERLYILIHVEGLKPPEGRLYGLVKASEWFASNAKASMGLIVDRELVRHPELSSVIFEVQESTPGKPEIAFQDIVDEDKSTIWPVVGTPHPFSPGEQLLAKRLNQDSELAVLFGFNQRVGTVRNNHYLVDLLWEKGRLIVEIDGYRFHSNRAAFFNDRQRDYELMISGYRVLRLDHDEVVNDVGLCIEKIRDVVRFNQSNQVPERNQS